MQGTTSEGRAAGVLFCVRGGVSLMLVQRQGLRADKREGAAKEGRGAEGEWMGHRRHACHQPPHPANLKYPPSSAPVGRQPPASAPLTRLASSLPRSALSQVGGPHFKADALSRMGNESGHKLETEVLAPLTRWQDVHMQLLVSARRLNGHVGGLWMVPVASRVAGWFVLAGWLSGWAVVRPWWWPLRKVERARALSSYNNDLPVASHPSTHVLLPCCAHPLLACLLACCSNTQARFKELENTRLELDSRRRTVTDMSSK